MTGEDPSARADFRQTIYARYLAAAGHNDSYAPCPLVDETGDQLYLPHVAGIGRDEHIVELGAGAGHFLAYLRRKGFKHLSGVDASEALVNIGCRDGIDLHCGDALAWLRKLPAGRCGAVVAIDLVEHLHPGELLTLLDEAHRVLRPGGVLLLQTVNGAGLFPGQIAHGDLTHVNVMNPASLSQALSICGFSDLSFHESGPIGTGGKAVLRRWAWRMIKAMLNAVRRIEARKRQDLWTENMICRAVKSGKVP